MLVSGSGTILESILASGLEVAVVASDRRCRALDVARAAGVEAILVDRREFGGFTRAFEQDRFTATLCTLLQQRQVNLIAMAGFGTITSAQLYEQFADRILNTHPSLLPQFRGWHAVRDALEAGVSETGCTVHVSRYELDEGPILAQRRVPVEPDDDEESLHERIKATERTLFPRVIAACVGALERGEGLLDLRLE